jgi:hypothetical protein
VEKIIEKFEKYSAGQAAAKSITTAIVVGGVTAVLVFGNITVAVGG